MAYLELVKKYHPDSGTEEACAEKFQAVCTLYKYMSKMTLVLPLD